MMNTIRPGEPWPTLSFVGERQPPMAGNKDGESFHRMEQTSGRVDHDTSWTTQRADIARSSHPQINNEELLQSGRMATRQRPTLNGNKRMRVTDEDEDELAMPARHNKTRASAIAGLERLDSFILRDLAQFTPSTLCAMINRVRLETETWRSQKNSLESVISQERESHKLKDQSNKERYATLDGTFKAFKKQLESSLLANMEDYSAKKVSDDTIKRLWGQLSYNIKNIINNYFKEKSGEGMIALNGFKGGQYGPSMLTDEKILLQRSINRRLLWHTLYLSIFSGSGTNCHGEIGQMLVRLISRQDPRRLPSPRYLQMIGKIKSAFDLDIELEANPESGALLGKLIQDALASFHGLVPESMISLFEVDMRKIFSDAWDIRTAIMASKAIFIVQWAEDGDGKKGCPYDPETMDLFDYDDNTTDPKRTVGVIESPVLWKVGNEDGENFDSAMVLCKHSVFQWEEKNEASTCTLDESSS